MKLIYEHWAFQFYPLPHLNRTCLGMISSYQQEEREKVFKYFNGIFFFFTNNAYMYFISMMSLDQSISVANKTVGWWMNYIP